MSRSRRLFLTWVSTSFAAVMGACRKAVQTRGETPAGMPPAFGTALEVGPPVSASTFAEAEKLIQFEMTAPEREMAAGNWRKSMAPVYERRTGPRKVALSESVA